MKKFFLIVFVTFLSQNAFAACQYYAYVSYGPAMVNGNLNEKQNVYKSSGLRKNLEGFRAVYTSYGQVTLASGFAIENIGPYDTEAVAYDALNSVIDELESAGYVKKNRSHTVPAIILRNKKKCN